MAGREIINYINFAMHPRAEGVRLTYTQGTRFPNPVKFIQIWSATKLHIFDQFDTKLNFI